MRLPRVAEESALRVAVVLQIPDAVVAREARLGHHLVDDPVERLPGVEVVVGLEDRRDVVGHQQLVDRHFPAGAMGLEAFAAVQVFATPFIKPRELGSAPSR